MTPEEKLKSLGLSYPVVPPSKGIYKKCITTGSYVYVSGHVSLHPDGTFFTGKLGQNLSDEEGKIAARQCALGILGSLKEYLGELSRVKRVIKVLGMINATPDFHNHAVVMNGCSELFIELWGTDAGVGVRSAVGMGSLPNLVAVEVEAIFEI
jgi:enamine deaminase RidA (YjgF/YER057c/UK114 family)